MWNIVWDWPRYLAYAVTYVVAGKDFWYWIVYHVLPFAGVVDRMDFLHFLVDEVAFHEQLAPRGAFGYETLTLYCPNTNVEG